VYPKVVKKRKRSFKKAMIFSVIALGSVPGFIGIANARVLAAGNGHIYEDINTLPNHRVGIVLGCSPRIGRAKNYYFEGRIKAAAELYKAGKVERLLVSGDNAHSNYNEPSAMEDALVDKGIPREHIVKDYAGFRTLDTMVRANKVFGLTDATIITDDFHMARSIFFAEGAGMKADGYPSRSGLTGFITSTEFREVFARGQAVIDQDLLHSEPKFLGKLEAIP
jgi:SanA protein